MTEQVFKQKKEGLEDIVSFPSNERLEDVTLYIIPAPIVDNIDFSKIDCEFEGESLVKNT